jgi:hypothetical protein
VVTTIVVPSAAIWWMRSQKLRRLTGSTPAVVVGRGAMDAAGFPRTRALLKGKRGIGTIELVEVAAPDTPYIVARTSTFDEAKKVADAVLTKIWNVATEVVCADPPGARVRVDVASGNVVTD